MASIIIVDDHPAIRMAVKMIATSGGHEVIGEYDNGVDALAQIRQLVPDILILDINIPRIDGLDVVKRINELECRPKVIVLSAHDSDHIKTRCIQLGVCSFISKMEDLGKLKEVIDRVLSGYVIFEHGLRFDASQTAHVDDNSALQALSTREMSVLLALVRGESNKKIAADLILSEKTISTYKTRLMNKLNVSNIVDLINFAKRHNLV
ncbi:response regulator transcription factor [Aeromonas cavernicola]|uniref:DNA-binding response regulator n=1 Tax=Aeromonas cavernicola TaxID=1006623 RepID=A0A2H9U3W5_9GAMM|nr:response regulator transcription factor [Aeromonas cavernicola]PJG58694.1 DNA-binding response regulator [Aeromonas cavernicola]